MTKLFFLYILSLLAGKFDVICTAFPLAAILVQNLMGNPLKFFLTKKDSKGTPTNLNPPKKRTPLRKEIFVKVIKL